MKPLIVILAGGIGRSFKPLVTNKTLIPICGKVMLQYVIEMAESAGFPEAFIITNPENEKWLSSYQPFNITLRTQLVKPTGMGDALLQAREQIGNQPMLVVNASDFIEPTFFKSIMRQTYDSYGFITGLKVDKYFPAGYIKAEGNRAIEVVEKPGAGKEPSDLLNLIFHYFSVPEDFFKILKETPTSDDQYEKALSILMKNKNIDILRYPGKWEKLKYPYHLLNMTEFLLKIRNSNHRARTAKVSPHATIEGEVFVDEDAVIDAYAVIKGPSYIGRGVRIGNHAMVRQSTIEEGSVVGFGTEVVRSYIGPKCALHHCFVGDSILESNINASWGTTFANWRIDDEPVKLKIGKDLIDTGRKKMGAVVARNVFLGVNCSIMPGVTLGTNCKVFPGKVISTFLDQDQIEK